MQTLLRWVGSERRTPWMAFWLSLLLFANTVPHGHNLDDNLVTRDHRLTSKGFAAIAEIFTSPYYEDGMGYSYEYRPVTLASFAFEHGLFGERPQTSHLINVLLFALTALLVTRMAFLLAPDGMVLLPALTGLLFAIHPMHVEAVASIKNRDELLSLLFAMGALIVSVRYVKEGRWHLCLFAGLLMLLSLLSKTSSLTFVVLIPVVLALAGKWDRGGLMVSTSVFTGFVLFALAAEWPLMRLPFAAAVLALAVLFVRAVKDVRWLHWLRGRVAEATWPQPGQGWERDARALLFSGWPLHLVIIVITAIAIVQGNALLLLLPFALAALHTWFQRAFRFDSMLLTVLAVSAYGLTDRADISSYLTFAALLAVRLYASMPVHLFRIAVSVLMAAHVGSAVLHPVESPLTDSLLVLFPYLPWFIATATSRKFPRVAQWPFAVAFLIQSVSLFFDLFYDNILVLLHIMLLWYLFRQRDGGAGVRSVLASLTILIVALGMHQFRPVEPELMLRPRKAEPEMEVSEPAKSVTVNTVADVVMPAALPTRPLTGIEFPLGQDASLNMRLGTASAIMGHYLRMMFIPWPQAFYYGFDEVPVVETNDLRSILSAVAHLLLLVLTLFCLRSHPILAFGILAYLSSMFLFSNMLSPVAGMIGDRLTYVASFGFCLSLAYVVDRVLSFDVMTRRLATATLMVLAISWSGMTLARNSHWKDEVTLMRRDIVHVPNSANANYLLGVKLLAESFRQKSPSKAAPLEKEAIHHMKRAAGIFPDYINFWYDLGRAYRDIGDLRSALPCFKEAHRLDSTFHDATLHVAMIAEELGNEATAIDYYERCIRFNPAELQAYTNLSFLYFKKKRYHESIGVNERAIATNPSWRDPYENIARAYTMLNEPGKAEAYMKRLRSLP